jgi:hypothetical protein
MNLHSYSIHHSVIRFKLTAQMNAHLLPKFSIGANTAPDYTVYSHFRTPASAYFFDATYPSILSSVSLNSGNSSNKSS